MSDPQADDNFLQEQIKSAPKGLLAKLRAALGAKNRDEILTLIRQDPEARRLALKLLRTDTPTEPNVNALVGEQAGGMLRRPAGAKSGKVEF